MPHKASKLGLAYSLAVGYCLASLILVIANGVNPPSEICQQAIPNYQLAANERIQRYTKNYLVYEKSPDQQMIRGFFIH